MASYNANTLVNSLKGKIWLATSAMAFLTCTFGLISYLIVSFVIDDTFYAVFVPVLLLAFVIMVFGWWLSNELVTPIEKVAMLARSLERSSTTSLPKTTGSVETDDLLQTLHRNSRQMNNLVSLMDEVANGHTDVALTPLQGSDRLIGSFQKLLAKVSESIDAKQQLEQLKFAVEHINSEITPIRKGNLNVVLTADFKETREISETLRFLINNLTEIVSQIRSDAETSRSNAHEIRQTLQGLIHRKEARVSDLTAAATEFRDIPAGIEKIADDLSKAVEVGLVSIEAAQRGSRFAGENRDGLGSIRRQVQEAVSRISRLSERSQEITKIAKTVEDLAHRTNMIALNASIQAGDAGEKAIGFSAVTDEIQRLAARADNTNKQISSLNKSISVEIGEVERSLVATTNEMSDLSKLVLETGNSIGEVEKYLAQFVGLQKQITANTREQSMRSERAYNVYQNAAGDDERVINDLKHTEQSVASFSGALKNIENAAAIFKLTDDGEGSSDGSLLAQYLQDHIPETDPEPVEAY